MPREFASDRTAYVELVTGPMLAAVTAEGEAGRPAYLDVFCEPHSPHAFTQEEARTILLAGRAAGLGLRVHGNQLGPGPVSYTHLDVYKRQHGYWLPSPG